MSFFKKACLKQKQKFCQSVASRTWGLFRLNIYIHKYIHIYIYLGVARSADRDTAVRGPWTATPSTSWRGPRSKKTCYGAVRGPRRLVMARSAVQEVGGRGEMAVNGWLGGRQAAGYSVALADFGWRASKRAVRGPQS